MTREILIVLSEMTKGILRLIPYGLIALPFVLLIIKREMKGW